MNALLAVLAFLLTALPITAQTKIPVTKSRTPIAVAGDYFQIVGLSHES
jgi:hypothetical protein